MPFTEIAYKALESVVGSENITNDPAVAEAYTKDCSWMSVAKRMRLGKAMRPACIILPKSTEEVQAIVKIANRYRFPFIPHGTGLAPGCWPDGPGYIIVDMKRMNRILKIDKKNMYAVVQPYVTFAQLLTEANKLGLYTYAAGGGSQISVLANHIYCGTAPTCYRTGFGTRNLLCVEWVLPTGEILTTGSSSIAGAGEFWAEGPGPDLRGLVRGYYGHAGGLGIVTKVAVKLHPWPGPPIFPVRGISIDQQGELPPDKFRWYLITYPTMKREIEAMYKIARAEIGIVLVRVPKLFMQGLLSNSREEAWKLIERDFFPNMVVICIAAYTSEKQLEYEEKVLNEIIKETGGKLAPREVYDAFVPGATLDLFRAGNAQRYMRLGSTGLTPVLDMDSIDHAAKEFEDLDPLLKDIVHEAKPEFVPPLMKSNDISWICTYDFNVAHAETPIKVAPSTEVLTKERCEKAWANALELAMARVKQDLEKGYYFGRQMSRFHRILGPKWGNYHLILEKVKKAFDPNNVSNPPHPISVESS